MHKLFARILSVRLIRDILFRFFSFAHGFSYHALGTLAIADNGGVHPKHDIMKYHQFFIDHIAAADTVIDIGCGNGANAFDIASKAKAVTGIDMKEKNIAFARTHFARPNITYVVGDILTYLFPERFDVIVFSNVLEHIDDRVGFLRSLHRVSDRMLLRVPMIDRDWLAVYKRQKGLEYRLDPTHFIEYTIPALQAEVAASGWKIDSHTIQFGEFWGVLSRA